VRAYMTQLLILSSFIHNKDVRTHFNTMVKIMSSVNYKLYSQVTWHKVLSTNESIQCLMDGLK